MSEYDSASLEQARLFGERTSLKIKYLRKLYFLLFLVFACATQSIYLTTAHPSFGNWLKESTTLAIVIAAVWLVLLILANVFTDQLSIDVVNWICYGVWLGTTAFLMSFLGSYFNITLEILMSFLNVSLVTFALLIYSFTTKYDLTVPGGSVFIIVSNLLGYEFFLIATDLPFVRMIIITASTIVFGLFFVYASHHEASANVIINLQDDAFIGTILSFNDIVLLPIFLPKALFGKEQTPQPIV